MAASAKQKPPSLSQTLLQTKTIPTLSPYKPMMNKKKIAMNPLTTMCLVIGCVVLVMYIVIFIEIDGINLFSYWTQSQESTSRLITINMPSPSNSNQSSLSLLNGGNGGDSYFEMFEHIHNTPFKELSPELQTRHLHELFRYRVMTQLHQRQKNGDKKQPNQGELLVLLNNLYADHGSGVNFVQIGACDGNWEQSNDPIQKFILTNKEWHGVMLEPVPSIFETLKKNIEKSITDWTDRIVAVNAALSDHDGYQTFYVVNKHFGEELPNESHALKFQIGSFNKEHVIKHLKVKRERGQLSQELDHYIDGLNVTTLSAVSVVRNYKESEKAVRDGNIDVLTIDAEGYDYVVLRGFLVNTSIRPLMVIYEHLHLKEEDKKAAVELLQSYGYIPVLDYWNTIGIRASNL